MADLHADFMAKAIAWVLADRAANERSAELERIQAERPAAPIAELERAWNSFHQADQHAIACDEAFQQASRKLAILLERKDAA